MQKIYKHMDKAMKAVKYDDDEEDRWVVTSKSFWDLMKITEECTNVGLEMLEGAGILAKHPDSISIELSKAAANSLILEAWLPYLSKQDEEKFLDYADLRGEYIEVPVPKTVPRNCGVCGARLSVVEGAQDVLCEECGFVIHVQDEGLTCTGCGSPLSIPKERKEFSCPFCSAVNRLV
jgi:predicted RNA-binding Zn-ribbon protein involved in translation (DUF1610 family)